MILAGWLYPKTKRVHQLIQLIQLVGLLSSGKACSAHPSDSFQMGATDPVNRVTACKSPCSLCLSFAYHKSNSCPCQASNRGLAAERRQAGRTMAPTWLVPPIIPTQQHSRCANQSRTALALSQPQLLTTRHRPWPEAVHLKKGRQGDVEGGSRAVQHRLPQGSSED